MAEELDLSDTIATSAAKPKQASGDSSSVQQHPLPDLIAADKYLRTKGAQASGGLGIKLRQIVPPGVG